MRSPSVRCASARKGLASTVCDSGLDVSSNALAIACSTSAAGLTEKCATNFLLRSAGCGSLRLWPLCGLAIADEPLRGDFRHFFKGSWFFKKMSRAGNNDQSFLWALQFGQRLAVHFDHGHVVAADDQQRWRLNNSERLSHQVRSPPARDDRRHVFRKFRCRQKRSGGAGARSKVAYFQILCVRAVQNPAGRADQPFCQERDVETKFGRVLIDGFFLARQQVK